MDNGIRRIGAAFIILVMMSCAAPSRLVPIVILHTTDLHGRMLPGCDAEGNAESGGLLRCASLIEDVRSRERNVLLVDGGDLFQGSVEGFLTKGRIMVRGLESLRYDAWVLGNHDFEWGTDVLGKLLERCQVPVLAANLVRDKDSPLSRVKSFIVRELDGVRVAIVGITTPAVHQWLRPEIIGNLRFESSVNALKKVLPLVKHESPDIIVLVAHQGLAMPSDNDANEIRAIAWNFPEIDVILGGHLHEELHDVRFNNVLYGQSGSHGHGVGRIDLVYDTVRKRVADKRGQIIRVGSEWGIHSGLERELETDLKKAVSHMNELVGEAAIPITASSKTGQSAVQQLIAIAVARASKADIVVHGLLSNESLPAGKLRRKDIWSIVPYENRIGVLQLTLNEIKDILEENAAFHGSSRFMGVHNLAYDLHLSEQPGRRIANLSLADGSKPHARKKFKVAFNSYTLASGGGRFPKIRELAEEPSCRLEMTSIDTRSAVIDYVRKRSPLKIMEGTTVRVIR